MKVNIELPFFPGFYESDLENSDTPYWAIKEELQYYQEECDTPCKELTENDLDFDYKGYEEAVREGWVDGFRGNMPEMVLSLENVEMTSPKYYNFSTDKLWADIELKDGWEDDVRAFMTENADWLRMRIKEDWTSYDGFMSFMSNNFDDLAHDEDEDYWGDKSWYWHLFSGKSDRFECYISTIIGYMMYRENKDIRNDLVMFALEDIYAGSYVFLTDEGKEKVEKGIEDGSVKVYDPDQLTLPFED